MATLDGAEVARLRAALAAANGRPGAARLDALSLVVSQLLDALDGYVVGMRSEDQGRTPAAKAGAVAVDRRGDVTVRGDDRVTLQCGAASLTMTKQGDIALRGRNVTLLASGSVDVKASADVVMRGRKVVEN